MFVGDSELCCSSVQCCHGCLSEAPATYSFSPHLLQESKEEVGLLYAIHLCSFSPLSLHRLALPSSHSHWKALREPIRTHLQDVLQVSW